MPFFDKIHIGVVCKRLYNVQQSIINIICNNIKSVQIELILNYNYDRYYYELDFDHINEHGFLYDLVIRWELEGNLINEDTEIVEDKPISNFHSSFFTNESQNPLNWRKHIVKYGFSTSLRRIRKFAARFPNIEKLTLISWDKVNNSQDLVQILLQFSNRSKLHTLKLIGKYNDIEIIERLNKMIYVKDLSLQMHLKNVYYLPIFKNLINLNLNCIIDNNLGNEQLFLSNKISTLSHLTSLGIWHLNYRFNLTFNPNIVKILNRLTINQKLSLLKFQKICRVLPYIEYLNIELTIVGNQFSDFFSTFFTALKGLPSLMEIQLSIKDTIKETESIIDKIDILNLSQVFTVKSAKFQLYIILHQMIALVSNK